MIAAIPVLAWVGLGIAAYLVMLGVAVVIGRAIRIADDHLAVVENAPAADRRAA